LILIEYIQKMALCRKQRSHITMKNEILVVLGREFQITYLHIFMYILQNTAEPILECSEPSAGRRILISMQCCCISVNEQNLCQSINWNLINFTFVKQLNIVPIYQYRYFYYI
jgi:hypothetical protein